MSPDASDITPARRRLLEVLKRRGEATADELAEALEVSSGAIRQHLTALRSARLVDTRPARGHTGRPADVYRCTSLSDPLFTTEHGLAVQILDDIHAEQPELIERIFERSRARMVEATRVGLGDAPIAERVEAVTRQLDAEGYLSDFEAHDDGSFRIHLHNCPISNVAERYPHACAAELGFIEDLLPDASVTRTMQKTSSCGTCAYEVAPTSHLDAPAPSGQRRA